MITPNDLTKIRAVLALILCGFVLIAKSWPAYFICIVLFVIAVLTDLWDGKLARRHNLETNFGKIADPIADKILILGVFAALAYRGVFSIWWLVPIAAREILVTAIRLNLIQYGKIIPAEMAGKRKTAVQIITITIAFGSFILQNHSKNQLVQHTSKQVLNVALLVTNLIAIYSGCLFLKRLNQPQ